MHHSHLRYSSCTHSCILHKQQTRSRCSVGCHSINMTERIKQQFDGRAATYDNDTAAGYHSSLAQKLLQLCNLQPGQRLLDLASGTDLVAVSAAAKTAPRGRVVALDISAAMLAQAKAKAETQGLVHMMEFIVGDMESLENYLPEEQRATFDVITCSAAAPFLQDPSRALEAWKCWLAPGGKLALHAFIPPAMEEFATFRRLAGQYGLTDINDPCEGLGSVQLVTDAMQAAGYVGITVTEEQVERMIPAASAAVHAENIWRTAVSHTLSKASMLPAKEMQALHDAYITAAVQELESSGRFDAGKQQVLNKHTVLYALGLVPE